MVSAVAGSINNIGADIAIGAFAGFFSGLWLKVIHPRVNGKKPLDHLGILGPVLILSTLGQLLIAPALYLVYHNREIVVAGLGVKIELQETSTYQLAYGGIAAGTGVVAAFLASLIALCFRNSENDFRGNKMISSHFGLYRLEAGNKYEDRSQSREELHHAK